MILRQTQMILVLSYMDFEGQKLGNVSSYQRKAKHVHNYLRKRLNMFFKTVNK